MEPEPPSTVGPSNELGRKQLKPHLPYDFAKANNEYSQKTPPSQEALTFGPRSKTAIIVCVDSRASPEHFYELPENEAIVIRNGGGRTNDPGVLRSLAIIQATTELKEIRVVHHANCGSLFYTDKWAKDMIAANDPRAPAGAYKDGAAFWVQEICFLPFCRTGNEKSDEEIVKASVHQDVEFLRNHPLIKSSVLVTGWYYNLSSGLVEALSR